MTNKEAVARIKDHKAIHKMNEPRAIYISEALGMAIKALENQTSVITELEKIKQEIGRIKTEEGGDFLERPATDIIYEAQKIIEKHIAELKGE